jgi:hypothetical protein
MLLEPSILAVLARSSLPSSGPSLHASPLLCSSSGHFGLGNLRLPTIAPTLVYAHVLFPLLLFSTSPEKLPTYARDSNRNMSISGTSCVLHSLCFRGKTICSLHVFTDIIFRPSPLLHELLPSMHRTPQRLLTTSVTLPTRRETAQAATLL